MLACRHHSIVARQVSGGAVAGGRGNRETRRHIGSTLEVFCSLRQHLSRSPILKNKALNEMEPGPIVHQLLVQTKNLQC